MKSKNASLRQMSQPGSFRGMSRSHLFLIELIVVILFFAFAGAVTVQVFAKAHELAQDTEALNGAILAVQSAAETDKASSFEEIIASRESGALSGAAVSPKPGSPSGAMVLPEPGALSGTGILRDPIYFDADWKETDPAGAVYTLTSEVALEGRPAGVMAVYHYTAAYAEADTADAAYADDASADSAKAASSGDNNIIYKLDTKKYYPGAMVSGPAASGASAASGNASASEVD